jgi:transposase
MLLGHSGSLRIDGPTGRRRRTEAERARIAAESLAPGAKVAEVARRYGTTRWQVYDWRMKLRAGQLTAPESVAGLPMFVELLVENARAPAARGAPELEIVVGEVVIRAPADADEGQLTRAIRAVRAATS